jgi:hypothetical protein
MLQITARNPCRDAPCFKSLHVGWCKGQCKGQRVGGGVSARVEGWETKFSDCIYAPFLMLTKGLSVAVQKPVATGCHWSMWTGLFAVFLFQNKATTTTGPVFCGPVAVFFAVHGLDL